MRYRDSGEVHKDFHGTLNTTVDYVVEHYGEDALREIFSKVGKDVYRSIHEKLKNGDASELIEHIRYYFDREGAVYNLEAGPDEIVLEVLECPAVKQVRALGLTLSPYFCRQTIDVNAAMCDGTPWRTSTEILGCGHCRQVFRKEVEA